MARHIFLACISPSVPRREVLGVSTYRAPVDLSESGNNPVGGDGYLVHAEVRGTVLDEQVRLLESPRVKEEVESLPGCQFAGVVLFLHTCFPAPGFQPGFELGQFFQFFFQISPR
jgi:hypothetical protein